jgi:uracil-DNA glycosylase family 4
MRRARAAISDDPFAIARYLDAEWLDCTRCPLGRLAFRHVLYEVIDPQNPMERMPETVSADILMVGEGPGKSEDSIGRPFVGPAGRFLRETIAEADPRNVYIALSNLVACRPTDRRGGPNRAPEASEIGVCSPRLLTVGWMTRPSLIVALGRVPQEWVPTILGIPTQGKIPIAELPHPAALKRRGGHHAPDKDAYRDAFRLMFETIRSIK